MRNLLLIISLLCILSASAQSDSSVAKPPASVYSQYDSVHLTRLNSSGNLMIAAGIGLCGAGGYLLYQGNKTYTTLPTSTDPNIRERETERNHKQGLIYYVAGGIGIGAGIILTAFGARNKVDFKRQKKMMQLQSGILDNGNIGVALNF